MEIPECKAFCHIIFELNEDTVESADKEIKLCAVAHGYTGAQHGLTINKAYDSRTAKVIWVVSAAFQK